MSPRSLFALTIALIGAAIALSTLIPNPTTVDRQVEKGSVTLLAVDPDDIHEVLIHRADTRDLLRLVPSSDGHFDLKEPLVDRAEPALVRALIETLHRTPVVEPEAAWAARTDAELGIAAPSADLEIIYGPDRELFRLAIGARHQSGTHVFASSNGQRVLVSRALAEMLTRPAQQWRDHAVVKFPRNTTSIRWQPFTGEGFEIKRSGRSWNLVAPIDGRVDPVRVRAIDRMIGMRVASLPTDGVPDEIAEQFRYRGGELRLTALLDGKREVEQVLRILDGIAFDEERDYLLPIYADDLNVLDYPASELRSRQLISFDPTHITSLRVTLPKGSTELRRGSQGWARENGKLLSPAGRNRLTRLLVELANVQAELEAQRPKGELARQLTLSISARVSERNATALRWWPLPEGSVLAERSSRQSYASELDLDAIFAEILADS
ncbi:MAG: DUF4340 domain-containing protein [Planctomycetes bacterium]|nr:DUF4340 domain-containing protein [Planctomycetota bacterium]